MDISVGMIISFVAILVMVYCLGLVLSLGRDIPGGLVGKRWKFLTLLVTLFTLGFLVTPFFGKIPRDMMEIIVSLIFLFGAVYVVITVKLIHQIIVELME